MQLLGETITKLSFCLTNAPKYGHLLGGLCFHIFYKPFKNCLNTSIVGLVPIFFMIPCTISNRMTVSFSCATSCVAWED